MNWLAVALGAAFGAPARYLLDAAISGRSRRQIPLGTLVVNLSGAALLGVLAALLTHHHLEPSAFVLLGTGFCGAYTTFSTLSWETLALAEERSLRLAAGYVGLSVGLGLGAIACTFVITSALV